MSSIWQPALEAGGVGLASAFGAYLQNRANASMAEKQMQFQERMSSTAYQRAVSDMRKAGLNPMLAYMQGGATSPSGASAHMSNVVQAGVSSALEMKRQSLELQLLKAQTEIAQNNAKLSIFDTEFNLSGLGVANKMFQTAKDILPWVALLLTRGRWPGGAGSMKQLLKLF